MAEVFAATQVKLEDIVVVGFNVGSPLPDPVIELAQLPGIAFELDASNGGSIGKWSLEETMDAEWVHARARYPIYMIHVERGAAQWTTSDFH